MSEPPKKSVRKSRPTLRAALEAAQKAGKAVKSATIKDGEVTKNLARRGPARFKERELARAVRAARQAGGVERVEIGADGTINVILKDDDKLASAETENPWDKVNAQNPKRTA